MVPPWRAGWRLASRFLFVGLTQGLRPGLYSVVAPRLVRGSAVTHSVASLRGGSCAGLQCGLTELKSKVKGGGQESLPHVDSSGSGSDFALGGSFAWVGSSMVRSEC